MTNLTVASFREKAAHGTQFVLMSSLVIFSMGQTVLFAIAGPVVRDIGLTEFQFGIIVSAAALIFVVGSPLWGRVSDRIEPSRIIVLGMMIYSIASLTFVLLLSMGLTGRISTTILFLSLLGVRVAYAVFGSGIQPAAIALMSSRSNTETRTSAITCVSASLGAGMILGPAFAVIFMPWGPLAALYVIAGLGLIAALFMLINLGDTQNANPSASDCVFLDWHPLWPVLAMALLLFTAASAIQQTLAFHVQDLLMLNTADTAKASGGCFLVMACTNIAAQGTIIRYKSLSAMKLLAIGLPIMVCGGAAYATSTNYLQLLLSSALLGLAVGALHPGLLATASLSACNQNQGVIAGVMQAMIALGFVVGPLLGTALYGLSPVATQSLIHFCTVTMASIGVYQWCRNRRAPHCSSYIES
ncbi:MAG: MFS transporter [Pseudomonadota bacterium]